MKKALSILLLLSSISAPSAKAQEVIPGDRIRVTASECDLRKTIGTLISVEEGVFSATVGDSKIECPVGALTRLEVSVGERKPWKATLVGLGIGIVVGTIGVATILPEGEGFWESLEFSNALGSATLWAMASITVGTVTGNEIGRKRGTDHWKEVHLSVQPFVFLSTGNGLTIGFSIPISR